MVDVQLADMVAAFETVDGSLAVECARIVLRSGELHVAGFALAR